MTPSSWRARPCPPAGPAGRGKGRGKGTAAWARGRQAPPAYSGPPLHGRRPTRAPLPPTFFPRKMLVCSTSHAANSSRPGSPPYASGLRGLPPRRKRRNCGKSSSLSLPSLKRRCKWERGARVGREWVAGDRGRRTGPGRRPVLKKRWDWRLLAAARVMPRAAPRECANPSESPYREAGVEQVVVAVGDRHPRHQQRRLGLRQRRRELGEHVVALAPGCGAAGAGAKGGRRARGWAAYGRAAGRPARQTGAPAGRPTRQCAPPPCSRYSTSKRTSTSSRPLTTCGAGVAGKGLDARAHAQRMSAGRCARCARPGRRGAAPPWGLHTFWNVVSSRNTTP
jgi:hypothetical protein